MSEEGCRVVQNCTAGTIRSPGNFHYDLMTLIVLKWPRFLVIMMVYSEYPEDFVVHFLSDGKLYVYIEIRFEACANFEILIFLAGLVIH